MKRHTKSPIAWLTGEAVYEGQPLLLRRPDIAVRDYSILAHDFPLLLRIQHDLSEITDDGLPTAQYNDSLAELDLRLTRLFAFDSEGTPVLIETFSGVRTYYFYLRRGVEPAGRIQKLLLENPSASIEWDIREDPAWKFMNSYSKRFNFE